LFEVNKLQAWLKTKTTGLFKGYAIINANYLENDNMKTYENLVDATNDLAKRGYTANLSIEGDTIDDKANDIHMSAEDFEIDEFYRFEGASNPSDTSIVYAINSPKYSLKGVLVNAYGMYADDGESALHAKLNHDQVSTHLHREDKPVE